MLHKIFMRTSFLVCPARFASVFMCSMLGLTKARNDSSCTSDLGLQHIQMWNLLGTSARTPIRYWRQVMGLDFHQSSSVFTVCNT